MDLITVLSSFVQQYPVLAGVLMVIGILRTINKPLFAFLHALVLSTPSQADDAILDKVEQSGFYKGVSFVLDWFASIKMPEKK